MRPIIDSRRAKLVFRQLLDALRANQYPYNIAALPQDLVPAKLRQDPLRHAQFLFYVCHYMRGAIRSETAVQQLVALWYEEPWLFEPAEVARNVSGPESIGEQLRRAIDYHTDQIAGFWLENSRRLRDSWQSDPRNIFQGVTDGEEARQRIINKKEASGVKPSGDLFHHGWGFFGFQGKMASMLAYFLMEAKLIPPFPMAPAVDFHLLRIMLATGIIQIDPEMIARGIRYDQIQSLGQKLLEEYCAKTRVSTVEIGDALWVLSTTLCRAAPGNASTDRSKERRPRKEKLLPKPLPLDPHDAEHLRRYWASCGNCPAAHHCTLSIPSGPYYEGGVFLPHQRIRLPSPIAGLFDELPLHATKTPLSFRGKLLTQGEHIDLFET